MSPTFFAAVVCLVGLFTTRSGALTWQMVFCLFGSASAITLTALGGASVTPSVLFLPFLLFRAWSEHHGSHDSGRIPRSGLWLLLFVIFGALGAYFVPRIFAGDVNILTVDRSVGSGAVASYPL